MHSETFLEKLEAAEPVDPVELLEALLASGAHRKGARALSETLLRRFGAIRAIATADKEELIKIKGLGEAKIALLKSLVPLATQIYADKIVGVKEKYQQQTLVDTLILSMRDLRFEVFKLVLLNAQRRIMKIVDLFRGSVASGTIYPREVVNAILNEGASAVVFAHNHPSGQVEPSKQDIDVTRALFIALETVGVEVVDHLIIGENDFFSFADAEILEGFSDDYYMIAENVDEDGEPPFSAR